MFVFLLLAFLGSVSAKSRIINGTHTDTIQHPHQVSLINLLGSHTCGGSIIASHWVLTAAHCVTGLLSPRIVVNDGRLNDQLKRTFSVASRVSHPNYNQGVGAYPNDIALLKTSGALTDASFSHIQLATSDDTDFTDQTCTITGWGVTESGSISNQLLETTGTILSDGGCEAHWSTNYNSNAHICIHNDVTGSCNGDSGGPMVCGNKLAGVTSWGYSGCDTTWPSVYTRVSSYFEWINSTINTS